MVPTSPNERLIVTARKDGNEIGFFLSPGAARIAKERLEEAEWSVELRRLADILGHHHPSSGSTRDDPSR